MNSTCSVSDKLSINIEFIELCNRLRCAKFEYVTFTLNLVDSSFGKTLKHDKAVPDYKWFLTAFEKLWIGYLNKKKSTAWAGTIQNMASQQHPLNGGASSISQELISAISTYSLGRNEEPVKTKSGKISYDEYSRSITYSWNP